MPETPEDITKEMLADPECRSFFVAYKKYYLRYLKAFTIQEEGEEDSQCQPSPKSTTEP